MRSKLWLLPLMTVAMFFAVAVWVGLSDRSGSLSNEPCFFWLNLIDAAEKRLLKWMGKKRPATVSVMWTPLMLC